MERLRGLYDIQVEGHGELSRPHTLAAQP